MPLRYIAIRVRGRQQALFEPDALRWRYFAVVSNMNWNGERLLRWQREKQGTVENGHGVVKNDLSGGVMPSGRLVAHQSAHPRLAGADQARRFARRAQGCSPQDAAVSAVQPAWAPGPPCSWLGAQALAGYAPGRGACTGSRASGGARRAAARPPQGGSPGVALPRPPGPRPGAPSPARQPECSSQGEAAPQKRRIRSKARR